MARKKKGVKDKYYHLAKEQGYRARSCFKLIQLNRKYDFLAKSNRVIDLCAAPGGWLQVCTQLMPNTAERQIIGVDLLPIKPIRGCVTFVEDITTASCRRVIKKELNGKKADVVLCDGAPNVGADYNKDAFVQSELVVHAFKFAAEHLKKGGIFISKVFRSADYNSLIWAFQQLFEHVEATKPASSRNVSAEIFVVCRGFFAPSRIDPKLFDISHVFEQVTPTDTNVGDMLFHKKTNKRKSRDGYDDTLGQGLYKSYSVTEFINSSEATAILATANEIKFSKDCEVFKNFQVTTKEVIELLKDIKVLNKAELRNLLKWRSDVKKEVTKIKTLTSKVDSKEKEEEEIITNEENEEETIDKELKEMIERSKKEKKKQKKKEAEKKAKMKRRKELGIEADFVIAPEELSQGPFSLKAINAKLTPQEFHDIQQSTVAVTREEIEEKKAEDSAEENEDDYKTRMEHEAEKYFEQKQSNQDISEMLSMQERRQRTKAEKKAKQSRKKLHHLLDKDLETQIEKTETEMLKQGAYEEMLRDESDEEDAEINEFLENPREKESVSSDSDEEEEKEMSENEEEEDEEINKDLEKIVEFNKKKLKSDSWFDQQIFKSAETLLPSQRTDKHKRQLKRKKSEQKKLNREKKKLKKQEQEETITLSNLKSTSTKSEEQKSKKTVSFDEEEVKVNEKSKEIKALITKGMGILKSNEEKDTKIEIVKKTEYEKLDEEYNFDDYDSDDNAKTIALATILTKKSKRRELLDQSYNRYTFNDENLPSWFVEDERKHYRPQLPVTKEMIEKIKREKLDLAKKPIKKVHEARVRKKKRLAQRLEAAKRKAKNIVENEDLGNISKNRMLEKLYKKAAKKEDKDKVYVIAKRQTKGRKQKNANNLNSRKLKGKRIKLVDKRMKSDARGANKKKRKRRG